MKTLRQVTLISAAICVVWSAFYLIGPVAAATEVGQSLTFASRVDYERKVQAVFHRRRTQPQETAEPKPPLEAVLPVEASEAKVTDVLRKSNALEQFANLKITPEMLQAEINRMGRETRQPDVLREIYAALGNDPYLVAEVIARPNLVERLTNNQGADFNERWTKERENLSDEIERQDLTYTLPALPEISAPGSPSDDTWKGLPTLPDGFSQHTIVWTGSEALVWGGTSTSAVKTNAGSRYSPATDTWSPITGSGAPSARRAHTAIWTGTEMIVWGGCGTTSQCGLGSGGRYNPATDSWLATTMAGAPNPRLEHTAVWTGDRMIIFGGCTPTSNFTNCPKRNDGGMYFPATDTWVSTSLTNAPTIRSNHTAVWTGTEMLVWGGFSNIGGRFDPNTNSWMTMNAASAPESRELHTAAWTGTEMVVWGGSVTSLIKLNTGGRYNPASDSWIPTSTANAPEARYLHTAIWTGTEMIIWGGNSATLGENFLNTGAKYNPVNDSWITTNTATAPLPRERHQAIWTGSEMILWGGRRDLMTARTGGRYTPATDSWLPTNTNDAPFNNLDGRGVWTGAEMIVFGGTCCGTNVGAKYNLATAIWTPIPTLSEIGHRQAGFSLVWTGTEMIVWGGGISIAFDDGARYNPASDTWMLTSQINAPEARTRHSAVWTGTEMIIWGGDTDNGKTNTGGRYNPSTNSWIATSTVNAPEPRYIHSAAIAGGQMIVWGGVGASDYLNTGGRYNFAANSWQPVSTVNAPTKRYFHTAISTGTEMIIWGGRFANVDTDAGLNTGGRYNPATDIWTPTSQTNAPSPRSRHTAVWTGSEMIIYAGNTPSFFQYLNDGGRYNPATDSWRTVSLLKIGTKRADHVAVWTGSSMLIWGGQFSDATSRTGYEYFANSNNNRAKFDFDGDAKTDISIFRPNGANGAEWWWLKSSTGGNAALQFGATTDKIAAADFTGDGKTDVAVWRPSTGQWFVLRSEDFSFYAFPFGTNGDVPAPADYDADGKTDAAVFRPSTSTWYISRSAGGTTIQTFGQIGDQPVAADYDGDGKADIGIFRRNGETGTQWWIQRSSTNVTFAVQFGSPTDKAVPGDYTGDGKADIAFWTPSSGNWFVLRSEDFSYYSFPFGVSTDVPAPGDYDGDGKLDAAVFRPSGSTWFVNKSGGGTLIQSFGQAGDLPVPNAFVR